MTYHRHDYSRLSLEEAIERIHQLEEKAGLDFVTDPQFKFTGFEQVVLGILSSSAQVISKDRLYVLLYGMDSDPPNQRILDVWICKLRAKLTKLDIKILTVWGRGWHVDPENRAKIRALELKVSPDAA